MPRTDDNQKFVLKVIFLNNRIEMYEQYIKYAYNHGYRICTVEEFWEERATDQKHFVLRHDVDHVSEATRIMYKTEMKCGVCSTYYFRHSTFDFSLMREMQNNGFEVGLHYETLSDYADKYHLDSVNMQDIKICRDQLKKEISELNCKLIKPISTICSHGAPANKRIRCSNNVLVEGLDKEEYADFGIKCEAYDREMYEKNVDVHIMDNDICNNYGFSYKENPIDAIESGAKNIVFLSHPNHWYYTVQQRMKDVCKILAGRQTVSTDRKFVRIQDKHVE